MTDVLDLPPELDIFLDFVRDDRRPTFVLEDSSPTRIIFRNTAFDVLVAQISTSETLISQWTGQIFHASRRSERVDDVGTLAGRVWSSKRLGGRWTAVFCSQEEVRLVAQTSIPPIVAEQQQQQPQELGQAKRLRRNGNRAETSKTASQCHSHEDAQTTQDDAENLSDLKVDWLQFPHLTADPWIHFLRDHPWENTGLGPPHTWDPVLRQMYAVILSSTEPRAIYWGEDLCMIYNEAARFVVGEMHPNSLGRPLADIWGADMLVDTHEMLRRGIKQGKSVRSKRTEFVINRNGVPESTFFDFVFIPIPTPDGRFVGIMNEFTEITANVLQENRSEILKNILDTVAKANDHLHLWTAFVATLEAKSMDISYALVYEYDATDDNVISPEASTSLDPQTPHLQASFGIAGYELGSPPTPALAATLSGTEDIVDLSREHGSLPEELAVSLPDDERYEQAQIVHTACIIPITDIRQRRRAAVILGLDPTRPISESSRQFMSSMQDLLFKFATILSLPTEQRRIQEMAITFSQQLDFVTRKAERSETNFTRMVRDAPIGMCVYERDGYPSYFNEVYLELFNTTRNEFYQAAESGLAWEPYIFEEDDQLVADFWKKIMRTNASSLEFRVKSPAYPNGARWLEITTQTRFDDNGNMIAMYGWLTDISSKKVAESLIVQRLQHALETKQQAERFIDMVSHEMRNPLSSILQLADNIQLSLPAVVEESQSSVITADTHDSLIDMAQTITLCAKHQKTIIDEVLTFSKLDSNLLVLAPERVQPPTIIKSAIKMVAAELEHAKIDCSFEVEQRYTDLAIGDVSLDPGRVLQVLINLLTNAIKFTRDSDPRRIKIKLSASREKPSERECNVTFIAPRIKTSRAELARSVKAAQGVTDRDVFLIYSVTDTGCGLTNDEMDHLFHRFSQASPKTYRSYGGSGLGLFISRELTELQGGQIGVQSTSGQGSMFAFYVRATPLDTPEGPWSLPVHPGPPSSAVANDTKNESGLVIANGARTDLPKLQIQDLHVLVVEDNVINQKVMIMQLRKLGCASIHGADHGVQALDFLSTTTFCPSSTSSGGKTPLSIVLLDVEMPVMGGLACARRIREMQESGQVKGHVPVIGITANARTDQIADCLAAGMDEVLTKPFRMPELIPRMLALAEIYR